MLFSKRIGAIKAVAIGNLLKVRVRSLMHSFSQSIVSRKASLCFTSSSIVRHVFPPNDNENRFVQHFSSETLGTVSGVNISSLSSTSDSPWQLNAWKHWGPNLFLLSVAIDSSDCGRSCSEKLLDLDPSCFLSYEISVLWFMGESGARLRNTNPRNPAWSEKQ